MAITMNRDVRRLEIRLLVAFEAIHAERNVTRAAERADLTQQAMSGQLAQLRQIFGDPLFVRGRGGVVPTPRAEELAPAVRAALAALEPLVAQASFDPACYEGTMTIAASDYALALLMPPLLGRIRGAAPGLRLMVRPADLASLEVEMRDARIDLALTVPEFIPPGFRLLHLFEERYVGVARTDHPILAAGPVTLDGFCAHHHLLVAPFRGDATGPTDLALAAVGRRRTIGLVVPGFSVVGALLERTDLIAVLPARLIAMMRRDLAVFEPPLPVPGFSLNAYWPPRLDTSPAHVWLREQIAAAAAGR
ncbi:LysR family transcriptional regulator [Marinibaculum pumilum]|uniref:LysR family transcriptional regulator n=1 Tax=Marinibaculum pumilum TaxID=1766165 RepID=A0ABV7L012_9PROT